MKTCGTGAASRRAGLLTLMMMMSLAAVGCGGGGGGGGATAQNTPNSGSQPVPVSPFTPPAATPSPAPSEPAPAPAPAPAAPTPPAAAPSPPPSAAGGVMLAWELPSDTSALGALAGFHIHYGTSKDVLSETIVVDNPGVLSYVVDTLPAGTYYFAVRAVTADGNKSSLSNVISKVIS